MFSRVTHLTIMVPDQYEALEYYTSTFGFKVHSDTPLDETGENRWLTMILPDQPGLEFILQTPDWGPEPDRAEREAAIGKTGLVFATEDCRKASEELKGKGVTFTMEPEEVPWGVQAVLRDKYGNTHVMVEQPPAP